MTQPVPGVHENFAGEVAMSEPPAPQSHLEGKCRHCDGTGDASEKGRIEECCACEGTGKASAEPDEWQYFCDGKWRHSTNPTYHRETGYPMRPLYAHPPAPRPRESVSDTPSAALEASHE